MYVSKIIKDASFRKNEGMFVLEGMKMLREACSSGVEVLEIFCDSDTKKDIEFFDFLNRTSECFEIEGDIIRKISDVESSYGLVCLCRVPAVKSFDLEKLGEVVVLENVQDPGNLGAIIRSCAAFGVKNLVLSQGSCDIFNPKTIRASAGSVFKVNIVYVENICDFLSNLNNFKFKIYGMVPCSNEESFEILGETTFESKKVALVAGNEGHGISIKTLDCCNARLTIPMSEFAESLNVSVSVSMAIWELFKFKVR
jgi:TrmH family RNA methyltransferase